MSSLPSTSHAIAQGGAHAVNVSVLVGAMFHWLPDLSAVIPVIYFTIQIYESKTVQSWLERRRKKPHAPPPPIA